MSADYDLRQKQYKPVGEYEKPKIRFALSLVTNDILTDQNTTIYAKIIQKSLEYSNTKTNETIYRSSFVFAFLLVVHNDEIVDAFCQSIESFRLRTEFDKNALDEILSDFQADIDYFHLGDENENEIQYDA